MKTAPIAPVRLAAVVLVILALPAAAAPVTAPQGLVCTAEQTTPLVPKDPARCAELAPKVRHPAAMPLDEYEAVLNEFLRGFCHRDRDAGWKSDKTVRDTGPFTANFAGDEWTGEGRGTHAPVVIWYSEEMLAWMAENRPPEEGEAPATETPVPDGAVMVKEMYPAPAAACAGVEVTKLLPTSGAAVMVRDREASHDGWFWGWFGWSGWDPDWPAGAQNRYPYMGFGQYCVNCHASARDNLTFASLRNVEGEPGEPLVFLSQHFFRPEPVPSHHRLVSLPTDDAPRLGQPLYGYSAPFVKALPADSLPRPSWETVTRMPSETYDNVWVEAGGLSARSQFVTSDQCVGCHDAGGTGLQFDMTAPNPHGDDLLNLSPYATWRTSPMGLGGRDPIFYAQLASETQTFHPEQSELIQNTCLGCHGILGQRQWAIDGGADEAGEPVATDDDDCPPFLRQVANAAPWPDGNPQAHLADFGALARDGISCTACHHMLVGKGPDDPAINRPENRCVKERQQFLNPDNDGFAATFTGSFLVGPPDEIYGPFEAPKVDPMKHALGIEPVESAAVATSELCGTCHTVHLPVMQGADVIAYTYEQTTYPEWAFSDFRTGRTADGETPSGAAAYDDPIYRAGPLAESCQGCHMPSKDPAGTPYRSKIAGIQEYSNFPQAEYNLGPEEIDLPVREGFALHTLVGLNVFFVKMAQQFPDVLGIRTQDPMLVSRGLDPLLFTEQAMLDQASTATAEVTVGEIERTATALSVPVTVKSLVGHKLPSGVGFRRAFLTFEVLDELGDVLWASGRANAAGVLVDAAGKPLPGELWWRDDCSARLHSGPVYERHHQVIDSQGEAQIYQELVSSPPDVPDPVCGEHAPATGPLTTSFLSICGHVKDNRILPAGFLPFAARAKIAESFGAGDDLAEDVAPVGVGNDPDYVADKGETTGGGDSLVYEVPLAELASPPAAVRATLYYQATPPFYLQDRFCTSDSADTQRLYFLAGHLNLEGTAAEGWKLEVVGSGEVPVH